MMNARTKEKTIAKKDSDYLRSALLLESIGQEPITINRSFVELTGNVISALWLTYALGLPRMAETNEEIQCSMTSTDCSRDTGITRAQQQTCRKALASLEILVEEAGQGRVGVFRINKRRILELMKKQARPLALAMKHADTASSFSGPEH